MSIEIRSPFPVEGIPEAYAWHQRAETCINGDDATLAEFTQMWHDAIARSGGWSWGLYVDDVLSGMIHVDPIYRSWKIVDGSVHIVLARRAWGKGVIEAAGRGLLSVCFAMPSVQRLSAFTPALYRPSHRVAEILGFTREGTLRDAACIRGKIKDLAVFGLTRQDWVAQQEATA